ncbi:sensor histidine kinase [Corynebacterium sp. 13CS0277]|uniref:sensor histidine kinase n=1 Tax=Corynebacterium sp. 13CS0277 TaxID=2071994 RepID=UPI001304EA1A|nr:histidine kinase [Corynebacterium sp. 13CS0277]
MPTWVVSGLLICASVALLVAKRSPNVALLVTAVCLSLLTVEADSVIVPAAVLVGWAAARTSQLTSRRWQPLWLAWILLGSIWVWWRYVYQDGYLEPMNAAVVFLVQCLVIAFGWALGLLAARRDRDRQALQLEAELAAAAERARIARDMHDVVAHNLQGIISLADGALATGEGAVALSALSRISAAGRDSIEQMRSIVTTLRDDEARPRQRPDVHRLLADARAAHLDVVATGFDIFDTPDDATGSGGRMTDDLVLMTSYRIIQEMLTNMLRYSEGARGVIEAAIEPGPLGWGTVLRLTAVNDKQREPRPTGEGSHLGVVGMRERVRAHNGTLTIDDDGMSFQITALIPLSSSSTTVGD